MSRDVIALAIATVLVALATLPLMLAAANADALAACKASDQGRDTCLYALR